MFSIDYQSREPIYEQLYNSIVQMISIGVLKAKEQLPPVRQLAIQLGVNPNTVAKAYKNLERDGIIYSVVGKGSFISPFSNVVDTIKAETLEKFKRAVRDCIKLGFLKQEILSTVKNIYDDEGGDNLD